MLTLSTFETFRTIAKLILSMACFFLGSAAMVLAESPDHATASTAPTPSEQVAELSRKAEILNSPSWRRAVFELGNWLDTQQIYTASQVASIKNDFNARVARASSHELMYLLDDLQAKFRVMDTPEARDARAWVGQYLSMASDAKRSELLKDLPDVTRMSAAELAGEIGRIEDKRQRNAQQQAAFDESRRDLAASRQQSIATTQRLTASHDQGTGSSYSPYHGGNAGGKTPFSNVKTGGSVHVTAGPFGAYVSF